MFLKSDFSMSFLLEGLWPDGPHPHGSVEGACAWPQRAPTLVSCSVGQLPASACKRSAVVQVRASPVHQWR